MIVNEPLLSTLPADVAERCRHWARYMNENIPFSLHASPIHTKAHAERVLLYALLMAQQLRDQLPADAATMLAHAAVFHDTRRHDDGLDVGHGGRAAAHYLEYAAAHPEVSFHEEAHYAMAYHDRDDQQGLAAIRHHFGERAAGAILVYQIFKDADALDRFRLGADGLDERFLRTKAARQLVPFARDLVRATVDEADIPKKMLLIVDPQYDFISGTLPVPGAAEAMDALAEHVRRHASYYSRVVLTSDWHPHNHMSFERQGGPWPQHCVQHSHGAAIYEPLLHAANESMPSVEVLYKGDDAAREEYSIFGNAASARRLREIIEDNNIRIVDVCGLAGDVCVLNTWRDGRRLFPDRAFRVLERFAPSIDGGEALHKAINE